MDEAAPAWRVLEIEDAPASATGSSPAPSGAGSGRLVPIATIGLAGVLAVAAFIVAVAGSHPTLEVGGDQPFGSDKVAAAVGRPASSSSGGVLVVDVQGAVAHPGVVRVIAGARVGDAITAAGGYGPRVATERVGQVLNLAALVRDGDQIVVPSRDDSTKPGNGPGSGGGAASSGGPSAPIDLNHASASELDQLPGIGPVTAAKIIAARDEQPFASVDDLRTRKLVGPATFDKLKTLVAVR